MGIASTLKVLDKGFVRLVDMMGSDSSIVRAARVSYDSKSESADKDKKLISFLLKHDHGTPFEHTALTFHAKLPVFVARQWIRNRIGVSFNEVSARYTEVKDEFYYPEKWRAQETGHKANKQGSVAADLDHGAMNVMVQNHSEVSMKLYRDLLKMGAARELARIVIPLNAYTEWYFTCNARSMVNFIRLRSDTHAQWETQQYSHAMAFLFREAFPWTFAAMVDVLMDDEQASAIIAEKNKDSKKRDYSNLYKALGISVIPAPVVSTK